VLPFIGIFGVINVMVEIYGNNYAALISEGANVTILMIAAVGLLVSGISQREHPLLKQEKHKATGK